MFLELRTPVIIDTQLSRAEVIDRLTRSIEPPWSFFPIFGSFGIFGRIGPEHCWFESASFFRRANRRLTLRYQDGANGTSLQGQFALPTLQLIPIVALFAIGTLMCLSFAVGIFKSLSGLGRPLTLWQFTPFGCLLAGFFMLKFNLWMALGSERELVETIQDILSGPPASKDGTWPPLREIVVRPRHAVS